MRILSLHKLSRAAKRTLSFLPLLFRALCSTMTCCMTTSSAGTPPPCSASFPSCSCGHVLAAHYCTAPGIVNARAALEEVDHVAHLRVDLVVELDDVAVVNEAELTEEKGKSERRG